jgi:hypothetical protein
MYVYLVGKGKIGLKKPAGKITEGSQGKLIHGITVENIVYGPEQIK